MKHGRKPFPLQTVLFAFVIRVLNKKSELESHADVFTAFAATFRRTRIPSGATVTRNIRSEAAVLLLQRLIRTTGLAAREFTDGIVYADGAEFNAPNRDAQDPHLPQNEQKAPSAPKKRRAPKIPIESTVKQPSSRERRVLRATMTVKLHPLIHHTTKLIIAAIVTTGKSADSKQAVPLLQTAQRDHTIKEFIADKGYSGAPILQYCEDNNILPVIPPKENYISDDDGAIVARYTAKWRAEGSPLPDKYGLRNNAEGSHSALKRMQYEDLRSRSFLAQQAEVLSMVLLRNLRRLVYLYVVDGIDIPWLDQRCRDILNPVRDKLKNLPDADRSPRFHDDTDRAA